MMPTCDLELVGMVRNSSFQTGICPDGLKFDKALQLVTKVCRLPMNFETR